MIDREMLLPCPFCGGRPKLKDLAGWEVHCACGADLCLATPDKQNLVAAWNRRAGPDAGKHDPMEGQEISVDVSAGDHDAHNRIFAALTGEKSGDIWLAEETSRNFAAEIGKSMP